METTTMGERSHSASVWVLVIVALLIGGFVGYYLGAQRVGTGLIEDDTDTNGAVETEGEATVDGPANPFEEDGYQNPFE
jgi:hypothetical protein